MFSLCMSLSMIFLIFQVIKGVGSILIMIDSCKNCFLNLVYRSLDNNTIVVLPEASVEAKTERKNALKSSVHLWILFVCR